MADYTLIPDLETLIETIQPDSIVSRTFHKNGNLKAIMFGFDTGQELSEHTSSQSAMIQIIKGDATVTLGDDQHELSSGAWMSMPPRLKHSVYAKTPLLMLLLMFGKE
jgi:quercetin dioxygenase-like cupin family protein